MAAELAGDLSKTQKRELKWERKQVKIKAAAEAAGQTYVPPSKAEKDAATAAPDKMGKRKKRKLAALQQETGISAVDEEQSKVSQPGINGEHPPTPKTSEDASANQSKADRKAAKKAKKAAAADATTNPPSAAATDADADTAAAKPKKKKKKSGAEAEASPTLANAEASAEAPKKKSKKHKTSDTPQGRITVHQEAVLASVGDKELAKSGKSIQKALYHEHPSVTVMTAEEVTKHRLDRDTAVTGADLRPVLQFDQAGK